MPINNSQTDTIALLRTKAEAVRASGQKRYPSALREEISTCVASLRRQGMAWDECKEALGICKATLYAWHRESQPSATAAMVPVKIRSDKKSEASDSLRVVTPNGFELSGIGLAQAAELLRTLG